MNKEITYKTVADVLEQFRRTDLRTKTELARRLDVKPPALKRWVDQIHIPNGYYISINELAKEVGIPPIPSGLFNFKELLK